MGNPLLPGEEGQSLGKIIGSALGIQDSLIGSLLIFIGWFISSCASGIRLYLRKKQGTAVFGFAWLYLILHFVLLLILYVNWESQPVKSNLPEPSIWGQIYSDKFMLVYLAGIGILLIFYLFRDFLPPREGVEQSPNYTGKGILSFLAKGDYQKELYTNLADPFIGSIIGYWLFQNGSTSNLGIWILICSGCLLIESLAHLAQDWRRRQGKIISEIMGEEYSGKTGNNRPSNQQDGKYPQID